MDMIHALEKSFTKVIEDYFNVGISHKIDPPIKLDPLHMVFALTCYLSCAKYFAQKSSCFN